MAAYLGFALVHFEHDKALHFSTFFLLAIELWFLWDKPGLRLFAFIIILSIGVVLEFVQNIVNPERVFDAMDIAYNLSGALIAFLLCFTVHKYRRKERKSRRTAIELESQPSGRVATPNSDEELDGFVNVKSPNIV